jgi:hypothetical protein
MLRKDAAFKAMRERLTGHKLAPSWMPPSGWRKEVADRLRKW